MVRITAGRLHQISQALGVEVGYFFDGMGGERAFKPTPQQRMPLELARNFARISNPQYRNALGDLARVLAAA